MKKKITTKISKKIPKDRKEKIPLSDLALKKLFDNIHGLIESTRAKIAHSINSNLVILYWHIGEAVRKEILKERRAEYGEEIVQTLSKKLTQEYGRGYSKSNISNF